MHSKSDKKMKKKKSDKAEKVIELFQSLISRYQIGLETSMKGSEFVFDCVQLLYWKCHKIYLNRGRSYIDTPDSMKNKKTTKINLINKKDNICFHYPVRVTLNYKEIKKDPEIITKIKPFVKKYNWEKNKLSIKKKMIEKKLTKII